VVVMVVVVVWWWWWSMVVVVIEFSSVSYLLCWLKDKLSTYRTSTYTQRRNKQHTKRRKKIYGIHICALIVKIQEYTNKCTILQYKLFTVKTPELRHISAFLVGHP
jgi:hypothetical protein